MRICIVYDCLFPYTVGGAERWYRNLAERLDAEGHEVSYLTLRQWPRRERPALGGRTRVWTAGPRMELYTRGGRRSTLPPLVFGAGVLAHLARHGRRYDVVHTASFPYFSLLAAAARPLGRYRLVVDWHEVWSLHYWREYLGRLGGTIGYAVQLLCARIPQRAFCFSRLYARRLREERLAGEVTVLEGEYRGSPEPLEPQQPQQLVVFAGRMIPEKRAPVGVAAVVEAAARVDGLRAQFFGDGPERTAVLAAIAAAGAESYISAPGFVAAEEVEAALRAALCMLLPSRREGYGMIVVEAAARGTPSVVVAGEDNAATELIEPGVNGFIVENATPAAIAEGIVRVRDAGMALRESTSAWYGRNARRLSIEASLETVLASYRPDRPAAAPAPDGSSS